MMNYELKIGGGWSMFDQRALPGNAKPFILEFLKKWGTLRFNKHVVFIKMQSRVTGCTWRTGKIRQGKFSPYSWIGDLLQRTSAKMNQKSQQIRQISFHFIKIWKGTESVLLHTVCSAFSYSCATAVYYRFLSFFPPTSLPFECLIYFRKGKKIESQGLYKK